MPSSKKYNLEELCSGQVVTHSDLIGFHRDQVCTPPNVFRVYN